MILQKPVLSFKCNDFLKMANLKAISSSATLISPKVTRFDGLEAGERQFLSLSDLPGDAASGHSRIKSPGWRQRKQTLGEPVPHPSGLLEQSLRGWLLPKNCRRGGDLYKAPRSWDRVLINSNLKLEALSCTADILLTKSAILSSTRQNHHALIEFDQIGHSYQLW